MVTACHCIAIKPKHPVIAILSILSSKPPVICIRALRKAQGPCAFSAFSGSESSLVDASVLFHAGMPWKIVIFREITVI
jgi:hypothetical protein